MKNVLFLVLIIFALSILSCNEQIKESNVPDKVKTEFYAMFNKVQDVEWELENDYWYEAEFEKNEKEISVLFDSSGVWMETTMKIDASKLPMDIQENMAKEYADYELEESARIESVEYGIVYEIELEQGRKEVTLYYNELGKKVDIKNKVD